MEANLRELDDSLSIECSPKALENMLYRIEDMMLYENQDWLMLMKPAKVHYVS